MRITGGSAKGRVISGPAGLEARPTASKMRQAFFNILRNNIEGAHFLDLFAGTGLMGIEALSRGAAALTSVEENKRLARGIESDIKRLGFEAEVICADFRKVLPVLEPGTFDIIYADPPYGSWLHLSVLQGVHKHELLSPEGVLVIEHAGKIELTPDLSSLIAFDRRDYGQSLLTFFRRRWPVCTTILPPGGEDQPED